jgi:type VI secretion system secreted protein VgrG
MATFTQDNRPMAVTTPLGKDVLLLRRFAGHEAMSRLFSFELDLLSEVAPAIDFDAVLGKPVTISVKHGGHTRFFNGIVSRFAQGPNEGSFAVYRAEVVPSLWLLTRTADCRIFQKMTVPDIITKVFKGFGFSDFKLQLQGTFEPREFCVQYRETDFDFVSRLMEQYGLYYFFQHADGKHTMVIANTPSAYQPCRPEGVQFQRPTGGSPAPSQVVTEFSRAREIRASTWSMNDYNFMTPNASLAVTAGGAVPDGKLEVYDYPGEYLSKPAGETVVRIRMEEEETLRSVARGASGCPQFVAGGRFKISGNSRPELDDSYVLTSVSHSATEPGYGMPGGSTGFTYDNSFSCIPAAVPFRPRRTTPRPSVQGAQTAAVVGIGGEEIHTDQFGRVKVQFHWDREGRRDENSSCWIRVSHPWAGRQWGTMAIPRVGQEVIVDFLEGDPDQPIITGRVYNAEQMPPYALPAGAAISGTKSNTTKGGGGFNELSLDDTKGKERITIQAQRDMQMTISHNQTETVGASQTITVGASQSVTVGKDLVIDAGDAITIKTGDASLTLKKDGTIILRGKNISITGSGAINVKADGDVVLKGNKVVTN